eukprot:scaffold131576_cov54-Phaeocystis_antarctica.AAC.2
MLEQPRRASHEQQVCLLAASSLRRGGDADGQAGGAQPRRQVPRDRRGGDAQRQVRRERRVVATRRDDSPASPGVGGIVGGGACGEASAGVRKRVVLVEAGRGGLVASAHAVAEVAETARCLTQRCRVTVPFMRVHSTTDDRLRNILLPTAAK